MPMKSGSWLVNAGWMLDARCYVGDRWVFGVVVVSGECWVVGGGYVVYVCDELS